MQSPTNILKNVSKRKDNLHKVLANVANLSECAGVDVRQRLLDVLRSEAFVANSGKTYPRSKVERSCRRVLLLEPEERRQVRRTCGLCLAGCIKLVHYVVPRVPVDHLAYWTCGWYTRLLQ